ncbi:MAG: UDP-N-acetylmuramoylalanine--D-glutamate ligase [Chloroflexota bacterium]|nr:UDP-N-acetylmuramoylalanine--D-glutamate ligase [Chloroflexota bacterium]
MSPVSETDVRPIDLEDLDLDAFAGRPVAVLGLARSGVALARFLSDRGAQVTVYDGRSAEELRDALESLDGRPVRAVLGPQADPRGALTGQALVTTSPSINSRYPTTEPRLRSALAELEAAGRVPVISEVDLFLRLCPAPVVGVTGTKGKTTTSSLSAAVLRAGGHPTMLGGNIGTPLVEALPELTAAHRVVLELSELQLPTLSRGALVAVYTHVTADHLDRHGTLEAYRAVKRRLAELVPADGALVINAEDPVTSAYGPSAAGAALVRYRRSAPEAAGEVGTDSGWIVADGVPRLDVAGRGTAMTGPGGRVMPLDEITLPGAHSVSNVLAAVAAGLLMGVAPDAIRRGVAGFRGVEHRLETVAEIDGVRFVNDSMGTQPDAVVAALRSFDQPLVLIAGGRAKDLAIDDLAAAVAERASAAVLIGESGADLGVAFRRAGLGHTETAADLDAAVARADAIVRERFAAGEPGPGTVLLSPAAASFDMFADYAARGRAFKLAVAALARDREGQP